MLNTYRRTMNKTCALILVMLVSGFGGNLHAQDKSPCRPSGSLSSEIDRLFPGYSVVTQRDLRRGDRSRFRADHKDSCPGLVSFNFFGSGKPTFALALFRREGSKLDVKLLVAMESQGPEKWSIR